MCFFVVYLGFLKEMTLLLWFLHEIRDLKVSQEYTMLFLHPRTHETIIMKYRYDHYVSGGGVRVSGVGRT